MADQPPTTGAPKGVNMPKKRDPRLRGMQQPPQQQFFDSADYEVRKQQQQQANAHRTGGTAAPNAIMRGGQTPVVSGSGAVAPGHARGSADQVPVMPQRRQAPPPPPPSAE